MTEGLSVENQARRPQLTAAQELPGGAVITDVRRLSRPYRFIYTTGPFALPGLAQSIDWVLLNNDVTPQDVRVTVFSCPIGTTKQVEPPGPLELTVGPGETTHNANAAIGGFVYEIQVDCNSRLVFPYATAWPGQASDPLPGSVVMSAEFIRRLP
jgi:hypothetical protein